jgi:tetratricopeptide (TPR) repeat protein
MSKLTYACLLALTVAHLSALPTLAQGANAPSCEAGNVSDPDALIAACTAQLELKGDVARQVEVLVARAAAYSKKHQHDRAVADLGRALALDGDNLAALKAQAHSYYDDSQYDRAIQDFNRVIAIAPDDSNIFDARGNAFLERRDSHLELMEAGR